MTFEILRQQNREAEMRRQNAERLRQVEFERENSRRLAVEAQAAVIMKFHQARHQSALAFRERSQVVDKLKELGDLVNGSWLDPEFHRGYLDQDLRSDLLRERIDPDSIIDILKLNWREDHDEQTTSKNGRYTTTITESFFGKCLIAETFPSGVIEIRGEKAKPQVVIFGLVVDRGRTALRIRIPQESWKDSPDVFEEPMMSAYHSPLSVNFVYKSSFDYYDAGEC